jgi:hypothetical protein
MTIVVVAVADANPGIDGDVDASVISFFNIAKKDVKFSPMYKVNERVKPQSTIYRQCPHWSGGISLHIPSDSSHDSSIDFVELLVSLIAPDTKLHSIDNIRPKTILQS